MCTTTCSYMIFFVCIGHRGVINGKAGKAAALPKFSDTLTLSQLALALPHQKMFRDYAPAHSRATNPKLRIRNNF